MPTRIVIGAGGTAGHVVPALAVADALRAEGAEVMFVGGERAELQLVPDAGYELRTLRVAPLPRRKPIQAARAALIDAAALGGARRINRAAVEAFAGARFRVLHAAGERDLPELRSPGRHYDLRGYISDFGQALVASDLVISRAGGSIFEIAAHGRPAVLIPYPHATGDHQAFNA